MLIVSKYAAIDDTRSVSSLLDLCIGSVKNVDLVESVCKLPDIAEYARQCKEWFRFVNKIRILYFQPTITWSNCFGNFEIHFRSLVRHLHPYVVENRYSAIQAAKVTTRNLGYVDSDGVSDNDTADASSDDDTADASSDDASSDDASSDDVTADASSDDASSDDVTADASSDDASSDDVTADASSDDASSDDVTADASSDDAGISKHDGATYFHTFDEAYEFDGYASDTIRKSAAHKYPDLIYSLYSIFEDYDTVYAGLSGDADSWYLQDTLQSPVNLGVQDDTNYNTSEFDCVVWALGKLSKCDYSMTFPLIRYFECAGRPDMYVNLCEIGIIKPSDLFIKCVLEIAIYANNFKTVKQLIENKHVPTDVINIGMILDCVQKWYPFHQYSAIPKYLLEFIKKDLNSYTGIQKKFANDMIVWMYCLDPEYAKTIEFDSVLIDDMDKINMLFDHKNIEDLLKVAILRVTINMQIMMRMLRSDRVNLFEFIYTQTNRTIEGIREHSRVLFHHVCENGSSKIAIFLHQQGMVWTDISLDPDHDYVKWFKTITNTD
jgi:hypothetical protein